MNNELSQQILDILKSELSEITANTIVRGKSSKIGKRPETITPEDLKILSNLIISSVVLFGGKEKAQRVKEKLEKLI